MKIIRNEKQFAEWFKKNFRKLGYDKISRKDVGVCPDFIMLRKGKEVGVELETFSSNFLVHKHDINKVDEIVCLVKDIELGKPIIIAKGAKHRLPKTVSLKIDEDLLKELKIHCVKKDITVSEFTEQALKEKLKKKTGKTK